MMSFQKTRLLLVFSFVLVVLAVFLVFQTDHKENLFSGRGESELFFQNLEAEANDIDQIRIFSNKERLDLVKTPEGWRVGGVDGYWADVSKIRSVVASMVDMKKVEAKTNDPARLLDLGLSGGSEIDIDHLKALPTLVEGAYRIQMLRSFHDSNMQNTGVQDTGAPPFPIVADLIVGYSESVNGGVNPSRGSGGTDQFFVRLPGQNQAWLVEAPWQDVTMEDLEWMKRRILAIDADEVSGFTIKMPKKNLRAAKDEQGAWFEVGLSKGPKKPVDIKYSGLMDRFRTIHFEHVVPLKNLDSPKKVGILEWALKNGQTYQMQVLETRPLKPSMAANLWVTLSVSYQQTTGTTTGSAEKQSLDDMVQQTQRRHDEFEGWAYRLPPALEKALGLLTP